MEKKHLATINPNGELLGVISAEQLHVALATGPAIDLEYFENSKFSKR